MSPQVWRINLGTLVTTASLLKVLLSLKTVTCYFWMDRLPLLES